MVCVRRSPEFVDRNRAASMSALVARARRAETSAVFRRHRTRIAVGYQQCIRLFGDLLFPTHGPGWRKSVAGLHKAENVGDSDAVPCRPAEGRPHEPFGRTRSVSVKRSKRD
jgi:hypothetical protein